MYDVLHGQFLQSLVNLGFRVCVCPIVCCVLAYVYNVLCLELLSSQHTRANIVHLNGTLTYV